MPSDSGVIPFREIKDNRGSLISIEEGRNIPFTIKRVYYIFNTNGDKPRGFHAHRELKQVLICMSGSCRVRMEDANGKRDYYLDNPATALYIGPGVWREMYEFAPNTVIVVLASELYDENDYIRDYETFLGFLSKGQLSVGV